MKKVLVNAYFAMNLGDDLFLKVLFDRFTNVKWYLLTSSERYLEIFKDYDNVRIIKSLSIKLVGRKYDLFHMLNDNILKYRKFDAFLNIGGSVFMQTSSWKEDIERRNVLPSTFKKFNKKTFLLGANFGPFKDDSFIDEHRQFFAYFDDVCFRDSYSYSIFKDLNNIRLAPDIIFSLRIKRYEEREKSIGFSIIDLSNRGILKEYSQMYYQKIIEIINDYIQNGYKVNLFSFCRNEGDLRIANHVKESVKYNNDCIEVISYEGNIDMFIEKFRRCEVIVGTRFHSVVLGILFKQNVFPIIYSEKTANMLSDLNIKYDYCHISNMNNLNIKNILVNGSRSINSDTILAAEKQFEKMDLFLK